MADVKVTDNTKEYIEAVEKAADRIMEALGIEMERAAKKEIATTPKRIDIGLLRNSITHAMAGGPAAISSYRSQDGSKQGSYAGTMPEEESGSAVYIAYMIHHFWCIIQLKLVEQGYTQDQAHTETSQVFNYSDEVKEFYDKIRKNKNPK